MSYTEAEVSAAIAGMDKYRSGLDYEVSAALAPSLMLARSGLTSVGAGRRRCRRG